MKRFKRSARTFLPGGTAGSLIRQRVALAAAPGEQARLDHDAAVAVVGRVVDLLEQELGGDLAHPYAGVADGRDRDNAVGGEVVVVVADDGDLVGYRDAQVDRSADDADRLWIGAAHDAVDESARAQQLQSGGPSR